MSCTFKKVGVSASCTEDYSGVGSRVLVFNKASLAAAGVTPAYSNTSPEWAAGSFAGVKCVEIITKAQSGKLTGNNNPNAGGFSNVLEFTVYKDMPGSALISRSFNNSDDWGVAVPTGKPNQYYVLYGGEFGPTFEVNGDTGAAPGDEHGDTYTLTFSPMQYLRPTYTAQTPTGSGSDDFDIVDTISVGSSSGSGDGA